MIILNEEVAELIKAINIVEFKIEALVELVSEIKEQIEELD